MGFPFSVVVLMLSAVALSFFVAAAYKIYTRTRRPLVFVSESKNASGVVTQSDYEESLGEPQIHEVPPIVKNLILFPLRYVGHEAYQNQVTGSRDDMRELLRGCRVEPRNFFVPYLSTNDSPLHRVIPLNEAYRLVWGRRHKPPQDC